MCGVPPHVCGDGLIVCVCVSVPVQMLSLVVWRQRDIWIKEAAEHDAAKSAESAKSDMASLRASHSSSHHSLHPQVEAHHHDGVSEVVSA